jgi:hypothetical protein
MHERLNAYITVVVAQLSNELRIRVARSRDTILGWTTSGASELLLEFQRASVCRKKGAVRAAR